MHADALCVPKTACKANKITFHIQTCCFRYANEINCGSGFVNKLLQLLLEAPLSPITAAATMPCTTHLGRDDYKSRKAAVHRTSSSP
jgi:hypothetical protein